MDEAAVLNFSGITHDHSPTSGNHAADSDCSTITILRRSPMYDCLVLVKKYRNCLGGHALEFPTGEPAGEADDPLTSIGESQPIKRSQSSNEPASCGQRWLVSRFFDGDDPMSQNTGSTEPTAGVISAAGSHEELASVTVVCPPLASQLDDRGEDCELVYVPVNGLLDRLRAYTESGLAVDCRVYAFAMGLKTAERLITTSSMRELQETPI